ncbi:MAG: 16S rRNA (cytidine(1402)-2'-O)-methyltransferase [Candidatus Levybacteria bacterium RBG_16_35_11]|nr:MAG: 16S rRNA (cytidine(1402)-2'-O)-methyltransferase [Candidatus Levybacteria bacterium RBG_16_35_11]
MGNLYIVATPIGNLQDITVRAIETLRFVDLIVSEDTRKTGILLKELTKRYNFANKKNNLLSYYDQIEKKRIPEIIHALKQGVNVALVSDAGTPTISDPGYKLVRECIAQGIKVISVPGPSSLISALVSSGLPTDKFTFLGFLPKKEGHRASMFKKIKDTNNVIKTTFIIFVAPHDLIKSLVEMQNFFGNIEVVIARELTKIFEEIKKDKISTLVEFYSKKGVKGEIVMLFNLN